MSRTASYVHAMLLPDLAAIVLGYFQTRSTSAFNIAESGEYEKCERICGEDDRILGGACYGGYELIAEEALRKGATDVEYAFIHACKGGHRPLVKMMLECIQSTANIKKGREVARAAGHHEIVELLTGRRVSKYTTDELIQLCLNHDSQVAKDPNVVDDWNEGLIGACRYGMGYIATIMINRGATRYDDGLIYACRYGQYVAAMIMILNGANDWNWGLAEACLAGHYSIVKLMIDRGASSWDIGLRNACRKGHRKIAELVIRCGATHCSNCQVPANVHTAID